nr:hypothetical protein [Tanacetum cinerariifolium]
MKKLQKGKGDILAKATKLASDPKPKPAPTQPPKAVPEKKQKLVRETLVELSPAKRSKGGRVRKICKPMRPLKLVDEPSAEDVPVEELAHNEEEANLQQALELILKKQAERTQGPARPMSPKNKSHMDQFIFQRRTLMLAEASRPAESPSLDAELALTDSETESDDEVPKINTGDQDEGQDGPNSGIQDEGQAGPNPGVQDEGQAGSNPGDAAGSQPQSSHVVHAGPNLKPMDLEVTNASHLQNLSNWMRKVQSMVSVLIHQDTSSVPPMTTPVIDLTTSQSCSPLLTSSAITSTVITTTNIPPPPPQLQQSIAYPTLIKRIVELEQHMTNLLQYNLALEERSGGSSSEGKKRRDVSRTPSGSPPPQPPPPPPPTGASSAPSTSGALGSSQLPPPPLSSTSTSGSTQQQGSKAPIGLYGTQELSSTDSLILDDSIPDEQVHLSDDEDFENDHLPTVDSRKATVLASTYVTPTENSLLVKTRDMTNFLNWYYRQVNKTKLTQADLEGQAYEVVKAFYTDVINLQFQMEECHVTIQSQFFFNKDLEYLRHDIKGSSPALSISKMKAASYLDFSLELLVLEQMWIEDVYTYDISAKIKAYSRYGYDCLSEIVLRRADLQEHTIAEKDFKNLHLSKFEDLNLLLLQGHLDHLPGYEFKHDYTIIESPRAVVFSVNNNERNIMRFNEIYKFSDGTLTRILEALAYRVKEFKIKRLNPDFFRERNDLIIPFKRVIRMVRICTCSHDLARAGGIYPGTIH